jgi:hypothetical protein
MSRLLLAAHDPGPAYLFSALTETLRSGGHDLTFLAAGPAFGIWTKAGEVVQKTVPAAPEFDPKTVDAVLSGTGSTELERNLWVACHSSGLPAVALLESWVNIKVRFLRNDVDIQPTALGVLDDESREFVEHGDWCKASLGVIGQSYLESVVDRGARRERTTGRGKHRILFVSEVMPDRNTADWRGYTAFDVCDALVDHLAGLRDIRLTIKPHPREDRLQWQAWLVERSAALPTIEIDETVSACEEFSNVDYVVGLTSMLLIEAHLMKVPTISIQPDRCLDVFPLLSQTIPVATTYKEIPQLVDDLLATPAVCKPFAPRLAKVVENANRRTIDFIEAQIGGGS